MYNVIVFILDCYSVYTFVHFLSYFKETNNEIVVITEDMETMENDAETIPICARINGVTAIEGLSASVNMEIFVSGIVGKLMI